ncbi:MAG: nuclear transport factor 2 family protein [Candidatus Acidiferrales bacterium]
MLNAAGDASVIYQSAKISQPLCGMRSRRFQVTGSVVRTRTFEIGRGHDHKSNSKASAHALILFLLESKMKIRTSRGRKQRRRSQSKSAIIRAIIRLEERVWKVAQQRKANEFQRLVPSDAVMIFQSGIVPQPEYLATMNDRTISRYELRNVRGFMPNATTVILIYEALRQGAEDGRAFPTSPVIESTTWIKRDKRWVAILNQETPISTSAEPFPRR